MNWQNFWPNVGGLLSKYWVQLLEGAGVTIFVALVGTIIGLFIGLIVGALRTIPRSSVKWVACLQRVLNFILNAYVEVFRGTPMMVQSMVIYWGYIFMSGGKSMPIYFAGILIVSINTGAYITEIVRGGINSIDKGQLEGAKAIGMRYGSTMLHVIMPQTLKNIMPPVSNEFVVNIKDTSVLMVLTGFVDLYAVGKSMTSATLMAFETYLIISVIYFILTFSITRLLRLFERKLNGKASYEMYNTNIIAPTTDGGDK